MSFLGGNLLLAAPHELDPNFVDTVILVVEHSERGVVGLILNRPREASRRFFQEGRVAQPFPAKMKLYFGGPVTGPIMAIHTEASMAERGVLPGVYFSSNETTIRALVQQAKRPFKVFTGYAGWTPGQLKKEIELGVWRVVPGTAEAVFSNNSQLWQNLYRRGFELQLREMLALKYLPADPMLN